MAATLRASCRSDQARATREKPSTQGWCVRPSLHFSVPVSQLRQPQERALSAGASFYPRFALFPGRHPVLLVGRCIPGCASRGCCAMLRLTCLQQRAPVWRTSGGARARPAPRLARQRRVAASNGDSEVTPGPLGRRVVAQIAPHARPSACAQAGRAAHATAPAPSAGMPCVIPARARSAGHPAGCSGPWPPCCRSTCPPA